MVEAGTSNLFRRTLSLLCEDGRRSYTVSKVSILDPNILSIFILPTTEDKGIPTEAIFIYFDKTGSSLRSSFVI